MSNVPNSDTYMKGFLSDFMGKCLPFIENNMFLNIPREEKEGEANCDFHQIKIQSKQLVENINQRGVADEEGQS